jgi:L-lactate dehydrogenase
MKTSVIGCGLVGSAFAYRLYISGLATHLHLVDINKDRLEGEYLDISHTIPSEIECNLTRGGYDETKDSDFIIISAGLPLKENQSRLDLVDINAKIFKEIIPILAKNSPKAVFIIATNPADVMAYAAYKYSELPENQVIGSGTLIDSNRFRFYLSKYLHISPSQIQAFMLGEHGENQVPVFSHVKIQGIDLEEYLEVRKIKLTKEDKNEITHQVITAGKDVRMLKGGTHYAIASSLFDILKTIYRKESKAMPISSLIKGEYGLEDVYLSLITMLDENGLREKLEISLTDQERLGIETSGKMLREYCQRI